MSDRLHARISAGVLIPGVSPRLAGALIGCAAALTMMPEPFSYIAMALALVGALFPSTLATWGCALALALTQLARTPDAGDWRPYVTLAVVHLLHVIGALALVVEPGGSLQVRALLRPLRRWLVLQLPAQAVLALVLAFSGTNAPRGLPTAGVFAVIAAACVAAIVVLTLRRR
ncbi:hypothetical protein [Humibacter sp. RRB41]|uniref:hypothetical protein n=1 Tax=Humibacter sp. RRB41 TaxID=2919946 RepID=UPI001FA999AB|nr:hypothetical protein [Humibacter sp. RRB41]